MSFLLPVLLLTLLSAVSGNTLAPSCAASTFTFPPLFGASPLHISTNLVPHSTPYNSIPRWSPNGRRVPLRGLSDFCNVTVSYTHPSLSDTVSVQVWLPASDGAWNGRYLAVGGGGWSTGAFGGENLAAALARGYAASVTDGGHDSLNPLTARDWLLKGKGGGNVDWHLLDMFAHRAVHEMSVVGKAVVAQFYGEPARYSYFEGCSTGGRQGLASAQRHPRDFDGIVAACPAVNMPELTMAEYWPHRVMELQGVFPPRCELQAVTRLALQECDARDGLEDGVVSDPEACADLDVRRFVGREFDCRGAMLRVSEEAVRVVDKFWKGMADARGKRVFGGWPVGTALVGEWAAGNTECEDEAARKGCEGRPFEVGLDWIKVLVARDLDFDVTRVVDPAEWDALVHYSRAHYDGILGSNDPDLSAFKATRFADEAQADKPARRPRIISWHAINDETIPVYSTRRYYSRVLEVDPGAAEYFRYFEGPGLGHCDGPAGTYYPFDALLQLREWVEEGIAPESLRGYELTRENGEKATGRTRPLCIWPKVLRYGGKRDPGSWDSFSCEERGKEAQPTPERTRDEL